MMSTLTHHNELVMNYAVTNSKVEEKIEEFRWIDRLTVHKSSKLIGGSERGSV